MRCVTVNPSSLVAFLYHREFLLACNPGRRPRRSYRAAAESTGGRYLAIAAMAYHKEAVFQDHDRVLENWRIRP